MRACALVCLSSWLPVPSYRRAKTAVNDAHDAIKDRVVLNEVSGVNDSTVVHAGSTLAPLAQMRSRQKNAQALDRTKTLLKKMQKDVPELRQVHITNLDGCYPLSNYAHYVSHRSSASDDTDRSPNLCVNRASATHRWGRWNHIARSSCRRCGRITCTCTGDSIVTTVCFFVFTTSL